MENKKVEPESHHYYKGDLVMKLIEAAGAGFCIGNVIKYVIRAGVKNPGEFSHDLNKAGWYLQRAISYREPVTRTRDEIALRRWLQHLHKSNLLREKMAVIENLVVFAGDHLYEYRVKAFHALDELDKVMSEMMVETTVVDTDVDNPHHDFSERKRAKTIMTSEFKIPHSEDAFHPMPEGKAEAVPLPEEESIEPYFTLRGQDKSTPAIILYWLSLNFESLLQTQNGEVKARFAFEKAIECRNHSPRKHPD